MVKAGCKDCGQVLGGNVQLNRGGGGGMHQGGRGVKIPWESVGMVKLRLSMVPKKHQEGASGLGEDREVVTEGGGGAVRFGKFLSFISSGSDFVWGGDVGAVSANGVEVRGSECGFPATGNKVKGKEAEGQVVEEYSGKNCPSGSGNTATPVLL